MTVILYLKLNVWTIEQYHANCRNGTDTVFHRTYSCFPKLTIKIRLIVTGANNDGDDDDDTGGDDVNQLCEAGEEEFLEIMALVGMASKPLHVRRLQKALLEWIVEPGRHNTLSYMCKLYSFLCVKHA